MLIEGRAGTVLAAVGAEKDHAVAGKAVSNAMQAALDAKLERAEVYKSELESRVRDQRGGGGGERPPRERPMQPRPAAPVSQSLTVSGGGGGAGATHEHAAAARRS
jgi:hypothetical protein